MDAVDGAALLNELESTFRKYAVLPEGAADTLALWTLFTHTHDAAMISPILALSSPEKRSGKTRVLSLLSMVVRRPLPAANVTPAAVFRTTEKWQPTLLIDEGDAFLRENEVLRGILNSGHARWTACVVRSVGDDHEPRAFRTWAPKCIALIGNLHDTLHDRAIVIPMRRRLAVEDVERLRMDRMEIFTDLKRRCIRWANDNVVKLKTCDPRMPEQLHDRAADNWRSLIAIADLAGKDWPERARAAALTLAEIDLQEEQPRILLLGDIREILADFKKGRITSAFLVSKLQQLEGKPWAEWNRGRPITATQIARLLKPFQISPKTMRIDDHPSRGYEAADFEEAFARYLPVEGVTV
jgi:putative DNA primase/helicase